MPMARKLVSSTLPLFADWSAYSALLGGKVIGLPPILNFGNPELKAKVAI